MLKVGAGPGLDAERATPVTVRWAGLGPSTCVKPRRRKPSSPGAGALGVSSVSGSGPGDPSGVAGA